MTKIHYLNPLDIHNNSITLAWKTDPPKTSRQILHETIIISLIVRWWNDGNRSRSRPRRSCGKRRSSSPPSSCRPRRRPTRSRPSPRETGTRARQLHCKKGQRFSRPPSRDVIMSPTKLKGGFFGYFFFSVQYQHYVFLPLLRFHCVGGCWDRTQGRCDYGIDCQTL